MPNSMPPAGLTRLDGLPLELLLEVTARLDWRSLFSLERVSPHCRDAVTLHLGGLRSLSVSRSDLADVAPSYRDLYALLTRLTALRELRVEVKSVAGWISPRELLRALVTGSPCWPRLEALDLFWLLYTHRLDPVLLEQLCKNCGQLREVELAGADDRAVQAVLAAQPDLSALFITGGPRFLPRGGFVSQLPLGLRRLSLDCRKLCSAAVAELARCGELRWLELRAVQGLRPDDLAACLAGCGRLEELSLTHRESSISACIPRAGLPTLTGLDLSDCRLTDADLARMLSLLPGLRSVRLARCSIRKARLFDPTPHVVAQLSRLPHLRTLNLEGADVGSDWALSLLSSAPLVEIKLVNGIVQFSASVTAEGLLRLSLGCSSLRCFTLWAAGELVGRVECGPEVDECRLLRELSGDTVVDLLFPHKPWVWPCFAGPWKASVAVSAGDRRASR